ncbi:MAG TPA: hypothetical protein VFI19_16765 [Nocardioides sp.]|nr:hypothetical protein [Nocardioides sp.]
MTPAPDPAPDTVRTPRPRLDDDTLRALVRARIRRGRRTQRVLTRL